MNELIEKIKEANAAWNEIAQLEIDQDYSDAMTSIERAEAEGYYFGLRSAYIILNGHAPAGEDNEQA